MVENELVTGSLASRQAALNRYNTNSEIPPTPSEYQREMNIGSDTDDGGRTTFESQRRPFERSASGQIREERKGKVGSDGGRLYTDFMRNAGGGKMSMDSMAEGNGTAANGQLNGTDRYVNGEGRVEEVRSP